MNNAEIFKKDGKIYKGSVLTDKRVKTELTTAIKRRDKASLQIKLWTKTFEDANKTIKMLEEAKGEPTS